jgi:hypothetical protein
MQSMKPSDPHYSSENRIKALCAITKSPDKVTRSMVKVYHDVTEALQSKVTPVEAKPL